MEESPIYLDFNASTPLESKVTECIQLALVNDWGNPSSTYPIGQRAKTVIHNARNAVSEMIHCDEPRNIIFTSGGTESNNWVLQTGVKYYTEFIKSKDDEAPQVKRSRYTSDENNSDLDIDLPHIVTTNIEHDSVKNLLQYFEKEHMAEITYVEANRKLARVEVDDVISAIKPNTCLVTIMLANNETGVIQPVSEISHKVKQLKRPNTMPKILIHTDAAQAIGKIEVDVNELGVDYLTIVGHKFYGPRTGALYIRDLHNKNGILYPLLFGGGQENNLRPGTENTAMIAGLGKAAELVTANLSQYYCSMMEVRDYLEEKLQAEFEVKFNGKCESSDRLPNTSNVSFVGQKFRGYKILSCCKRLQAGVGAACHSAQPSQVLLRSGVPLDRVINSIRLSVGRYTSKQDIDIVVEDLKQALHQIEREDDIVTK